MDKDIQIDVSAILFNYDEALAAANHTIMVMKAEMKAWKTECLGYREKASLNATVQEEPKGE